MVKSWFLNDNCPNQLLENHKEPPEYISIEDVKSSTGVLYWQLDPETEQFRLDDMEKENSYIYSDIIEVAQGKLPNFEEKIKNFYEEHLHTDEEIRYVLSGSGYFDVRDKSDRWIRILVETGDLIVLPAGIYHRFTVDDKEYIKVKRIFIGEPVWTPYNRPADDMDVRKIYTKEQRDGFSKSHLAELLEKGH